MDVRMPDGTIIRNVPDGVTQEDVAEQYRQFSGAPKEEQPTGYLEKTARFLGVEPLVEAAGNVLPNAGRIVKNVAQSAWYLGDTIPALGRAAQTLQGGLEALPGSTGRRVLEQGRAPATPAETSAVNALKLWRQNVQPKVDWALQNPEQVPAAVGRWAVKNPLDAALTAGGVLGAAGKTAKAAGAPRLGEALVETGKAAATAGAAPVVGPMKVAAKAAKWAGTDALTGAGRVLYEKAMKIPPAVVGQAERNKILTTLTDVERIPLGPKAFDEVNRRVQRFGTAVDQGLEAASAAGGRLHINDIVVEVQRIKDRFRGKMDANALRKMVDQQTRLLEKNELVAPDGTLSLSDANTIKKGLYEDLAQYYREGAKALTSRGLIRQDASLRAQAAIAEAIAERLRTHSAVDAGTKEAMGRLAGLMKARPWVERATNRAGNTDVVSLGGLMFAAAEGHPVSALGFRAAMSQPVLTRAGIELRRAGKGGEAMLGASEKLREFIRKQGDKNAARPKPFEDPSVITPEDVAPGEMPPFKRFNKPPPMNEPKPVLGIVSGGRR